MKKLALALVAFTALSASSFAVKEYATCFKGNRQVGERHLVESNWRFHGEQSSCRDNNNDYCNMYEVACDGHGCQTKLEDANWEPPQYIL